VKKDSFAFSSYKKPLIYERHRHRYEFNTHYQSLFASKGMKFSGICADGELVEIIEFGQHPWFVATQFHPEFKSKPYQPHPLFREFIKMALNKGGREYKNL
jgi:CTP synthase